MADHPPSPPMAPLLRPALPILTPSLRLSTSPLRSSPLREMARSEPTSAIEKLSLEDDADTTKAASDAGVKNSPVISTTSATELTPPRSARPQQQHPIVREMATQAEDPFVTPPRGIEVRAPAAPREGSTALVSGQEVAIAPIAPATTTGFTPRPDRLAGPITAANAQGVIPPQCCLFVANLSNQRTDEQLQEAVHHKFSQWGKCFVKIRRDRNRMPMAFVSYLEVEHARIALRNSPGTIIDGRTVRAEISKGDRSVILARRTGGAISDEEARAVICDYGPIEETSAITVADQKLGNLPEGRWVKFAYQLDATDAQTAFRNHEFFYLVDHRSEEARPPRYPSMESPLAVRAPAQNTPARDTPARGTPARIAPAQNITPARSNAGDQRSPDWIPDSQYIFVGDLPSDVSEEQVRAMFQQYGRVVDCTVRVKPYPYSEHLGAYAFVAFENPRIVNRVVSMNHRFLGHRIRVEVRQPRSYPIHRSRSSPFDRRYRGSDPILQDLYQQGLQMGLPHDQAARILNIGQQARSSSAYGDPPAYGSPALDRARYGPDISTHGSQYSMAEQYGALLGTAPFQTSDGQMMPSGGTHYYNNASDHVAHNEAQYPPGVPMEPVYGGGYSQNYQHAGYVPLDPIQENTETEHQYSHESYGPATYAGEPYGSEHYGHSSSHSDEHGRHHQDQ